MLPLLATAQLNSTQKIVAQVPFEFAVGSKIVPSGEWIVQSATMDGRVLAGCGKIDRQRVFVSIVHR
jgi:hypothetical protein